MTEPRPIRPSPMVNETRPIKIPRLPRDFLHDHFEAMAAAFDGVRRDSTDAERAGNPCTDEQSADQPHASN